MTVSQTIKGIPKMSIQERKEREREQRREAILDAAQKIFFEKGLVATTMDEIAEAAELSKGTLYLYYTSKEDLYLAVHLRGEDILDKMFLAASSTDEPILKKLANIGDAYYRFFRDNREYYETIKFFQNSSFHKQVSKEMLEHCMQANNHIWKFIMDLVIAGMEEGTIRNDLQPAQAVMILYADVAALIREMDTQKELWKEVFHIDLEATLYLSMKLMLEMISTDKGKQQLKEMNLFSQSTITN